MTAKGVPNEKLRTIAVPPGTVSVRLRVIEEVPCTQPDGKTNRGLRCQCSCGTILTVPLTSFVYGNTKSCGCLHKEMVADQMRFRNSVMRGIPRAERKAWWAANRCSVIKEPDRAAGMLAEADQRERKGTVPTAEQAQALAARRRSQRAQDRRENSTITDRANARWERTARLEQAG